MTPTGNKWNWTRSSYGAFPNHFSPQKKKVKSKIMLTPKKQFIFMPIPDFLIPYIVHRYFPSYSFCTWDHAGWILYTSINSNSHFPVVLNFHKCPFWCSTIYSTISFYCGTPGEFFLIFWKKGKFRKEIWIGLARHCKVRKILGQLYQQALRLCN